MSVTLLKFRGVRCKMIGIHSFLRSIHPTHNPRITSMVHKYALELQLDLLAHAQNICTESITN